MDHGDPQQWQINPRSVLDASDHMYVSKILLLWQKVGYTIVQLVKRGT